MSSSTRTAWLLFTVAWGANHFVPLLLVYRSRLGLSPVDLATLFGVYAVGLVPGLLVGGPLSDRAGRRAVVFRASSLALIGTTILAFGATGFPVLLAGRFVVGVGSGATFSAGTAWMQDLAVALPAGTGARRASVALSSGFGVGPLVAGLVAQWAPWPMVTPYAMQAVFLIAALVLAVNASPKTQTSSSVRVSSPGARVALRLPPGFLRTVGPTGPWVFAFPAIAFAVLPHLVSARTGRLAIAYAGLVSAVTLFSGVLVQPVLKTWSPRRAVTWALAVGAAGLLVGLVSVAHVWPWGVLAASPLLGIGYGGCLISGLRTVESSTTARDRGYVTGVFYVFADLGFAAPFVLAEVAARVGYGPGLAAAAAIATLTAIWVQWSSRGRAGESPARRRGLRS